MIKYILPLLLLVGCCPCKKLADSSRESVKDSTSVTTELKYKDTTLLTPKSLIDILHLVPVPDSGKINLKPIYRRSANANLTVGIKDNLLQAKCECDALEVKLSYYEKLVTIYKQRLENREAVKVVEVERIPKWVKILAGIGAAALLFLLIFIVIKIYNFFKLSKLFK